MQERTEKELKEVEDLKEVEELETVVPQAGPDIQAVAPVEAEAAFRTA